MEYWEFYNFYFIGLPIFIQLLIYNFWAVIVLPNLLKSETFEDLNTACRVMLIIFALYKLLLESTAIMRVRFGYLKSTTRLIKLISPILILIMTTQGHDTYHD